MNFGDIGLVFFIANLKLVFCWKNISAINQVFVVRLKNHRFRFIFANIDEFLQQKAKILTKRKCLLVRISARCGEHSFGLKQTALKTFQLLMFWAFGKCQVILTHRVQPGKRAIQTRTLAEGDRTIGEDFRIARPAAAVTQNVFDDCLVQTISDGIPVALRVAQNQQLELSIEVAIPFDGSKSAKSFFGRVDYRKRQTHQCFGSWKITYSTN